MTIRERVSFEQIASVISAFNNFSVEKIGTSTAYYNHLSTSNKLMAGISILYSEKGYKSYVKLALTNELKDSEFTCMISLLAKTLNTDIAIGDFTSTSSYSPLEYLIISPDQKYQKAYEERNDDKMFEVTPYTEKFDISELLKICKKLET